MAVKERPCDSPALREKCQLYAGVDMLKLTHVVRRKMWPNVDI